MKLRHVHMGRLLTWQAENNIGEANVIDQAQLQGQDISVRNVRFRTKDHGQITLQDVESHGTLETIPQGGEIRIVPATKTADP